MKWILALLLFVSASAICQVDDTTKYISYPAQYGMKMPRIWAPTTMIMPYGDTTGKRPGKIGAFMTHTGDGNVYRWNGSDWVAFGGSSLTASNGLTKIGDTIKLGGVLTGTTHISGGVNAHPFVIDSSASISLFSGLEFVSSGIGSSIQLSDSVMNIGSSSATDFTSFVFSPTRIKFTAADGAGSNGDVWTNTGSGYGHWAPPTSGISSLTNIGTGYALVTTPNGSIKRLFPGYGVLFDSTTTANSITAMVDTSSANHVVTQSDLNDAIGGAGGGQTLVSDLNRLSQIKIYSPAQGISSSNNVTNYSHTSVDSAFYKFSLTRAGVSGSEYGGWLTTNLTGDSIRLTAPFWVVFGDSQAEGHPVLHGRLHPSGAIGFDPNYADASGQLSYHLRYLTNMRWVNHGIGGETTAQMRLRFIRDVLGETSNPSDSRGTRTLSRRPQGVVIIGGINDVFSGSITNQQIKDNLEWMASMCQQYGIRCVILNLPGDAFAGQTELRRIAEINIWLRDGALDQYGASVVDYNSWWNDPAYGYDNIHHTSQIVDDIHPSAVGYDSLANYIYRSAKLPVLTHAVVVCKLDPGGFPDYSRPTNITINSVPYVLANDSATINITSYVPDSVWLKITASTPVTGTSYTGISHVLWFTDNNVPDSALYTRRTLYSGSQKSIADIAALHIQARDYSGSISPFRINYPDGSTALLTNVAGNMNMVIGSSTQLNSALLSVHGDISNNGSIKSSGTSSYFGNFEVGFVGTAGTYGYGIGRSSAGAVAVDGSGGYNNDDGIILRFYGGAFNASGSSGNANAVRVAFNYNDITGTFDTTNLFTINPTLNNTRTDGRGNAIIGFNFKPTITNQGGVKIFAFKNNIGVNHFNEAIGWRTVIGDNNTKASAILELSRPKQGFLPPRMTTSQRDSIGYISAINISGGSYTVAPSISITGGTGSGATANCYIISGTTIAADIINHGIGYDPGSAVTVNLTGGTGSGASATAIISGPDTGLVIYNTTVDSLQYYNGAKWVNIGFEGISSFILKGTTNWTPGVVSAGSSTSTSFTVTGAAVGDPVTVSKLAAYSNGEIYDAFVSATNTVTLRVHNVSTGSANYSSAADYNVVVLKY